ncbi:MAG: calcium/sodium antiporter [Hyphomicrobiales bacterium]
MSYVFLVAGLSLLVFGGDILVRGAVALAVRMNIPHLIIGLTIVAFGTSAPELLISIRAALSDLSGITLGNVVGSNIANIWLVLGVPALISAICCDQKNINHNYFFMLGACIILAALCFWSPLTIWHGVVLSVLMLLFLGDCFYRARQHKNEAEVLDEDVEELIEEIEGSKETQLWKMVSLVILGLIGLAIGAELTIKGAVEIAKTFGVSDTTIGLTVVAIGTSLPELAATVMAAIRGHSGLALGNAIGSNIYNICGVLGITALITPIAVDPVFLSFDLWVMIAASLSILPFIIFKWKINKIVGVVFLLAYGLYTYKVLELGRIQSIDQAANQAASQAVINSGAVKI